MNTALGKSISQIHNNLSKSLEYIANPEKTNRSLMVSGLGCSCDPKLASNDFKNIASKFNKNKNKKVNNVLAHHYLISFNPGDNLSIEKSHELALDIAERFLGKEYKAMIATHDNTKEHIHTHIIFNSTSNNGKKYESTPKDLQRFKDVINDVCLENNLTPINKKKNKQNERDLTYKQWLDKNNIGTDKKVDRFKYIEKIVNEILKNKKVKTLEEFEGEISKYGIKIKYKNKEGKLYKNITFKDETWERSFRGKFDISLESIINRINNINYEEKLTSYKKWCYNTHEKSYSKFIKKCIDESINSCSSVEELAEKIKSLYGIQMDYLNASNNPIKRVKFLILNSSQKHKIGSASLDSENREKYEYTGLKNRCIKSKEIHVTGDLNERLLKIQKYLLSNNITDKWRISEGIEVVTRRNLKNRFDIKNQIKNLQKESIKNEERVLLIKQIADKIEKLYAEIYELTVKHNKLKEEINNLKGFNALLNKKNMKLELQQQEEKINELKKSKYYSKEKKYSERMHELTDEKYALLEENRLNDNEIEVLSSLDYFCKNEEYLYNFNKDEIRRKQEEKDKDEDINR